MALEAASLYAKLGLDSSGYEKGLKGARGGLSSFANDLKSNLGKAVKFGTVGLAALGAGAVGIGAKLVSLGSDAEEMTAKFETVFGESTDLAIRQLDNFGNAVGRNTYELMEMASTVQDTFVPLGFARDKAAELSVDLTKLAVDVASFNNQLEPDVMRDFQSALVGNHETVRKYGIIITEATLGQELMNMGIAEGMKAATEQEKVQARLNILYAGTKDAQGDAAKTAGGWANQMRALKSEFAEAATAAGSKLLPVLTPLLQTAVQFAQEVLPQMVERFGEFASEMGEKIGPAALLVEDAFSRIGIALGLTSEEMSGADMLIATFGATLDAIVIGMQAFAITMQGVAGAVEFVSSKAREAIEVFNQLKTIVETIGTGGALEQIGAEAARGTAWAGGTTAAARFGGGRQLGGPVATGHSYLVGERGPELFVPGQTGNVVSGDNAIIENHIVIELGGEVVGRYLGRQAARRRGTVTL